jgi:hypothetical protein
MALSWNLWRLFVYFWMKLDRVYLRWLGLLKSMKRTCALSSTACNTWKRRRAVIACSLWVYKQVAFWMYPVTLCQTFQSDTKVPMFAKYRRIHAVTELTDCLVNITEAWRWLQTRDRAVFSVITVHTRECGSWFSFLAVAPFSYIALNGRQQLHTHLKTSYNFLIPCYLSRISLKMA